MYLLVFKKPNESQVQIIRETFNDFDWEQGFAVEEIVADQLVNDNLIIQFVSFKDFVQKDEKSGKLTLYPETTNAVLLGKEQFLGNLYNNDIENVETNFLRVKSIKVFHGNSLSGKTCWLYEPYQMTNPSTGINDYYGIPYKRTQEQLDSLFLAIHKKGLQIAVHSNGDREIDMVLKAFEKVYASGNSLNIHHRIEHCSVINDRIISKIKQIGVIPVLHNYINELGDLLDPYGDERLNNMFATKSFLDAGVLPALHSDAPVSSYDPRIRWESTVIRTTSQGKVLGPKQCVDAEDALIMYTKGGANATGELAKKGSLEKGKFADFVIIAENPLTMQPNQLHNIHIQQTWVNGLMVFKSGL